MHIKECIDCYIRPWKAVEFSQRQYSSSCLSRERLDRGGITPSISQQEFEVDLDYYPLDETLTYKVCTTALITFRVRIIQFRDFSFNSQSESCTPSSRQSIASLSSVSSCTDTLTPRGSWASFDLRSSVNDPLLPGFLERTPAELIDQPNESRRSDERKEALFALCPDIDAEDSIERRLPAEIPGEHIGHRIFIKCLQLKLELEVEPIFASCAIYDAKERKKISDMNSETIKRMLTSHVPYSDVSTQSRSAIFEVTNPSNDLFLVIRLEKVLQGDIKDSVEPYMKEDKDKYRDKAKSNAADYCERLGKYRMPFAWTGIYLTNIFNGDSMETSTKEEKDRNDSIASAASSNSLDRKSSTSSFDQLRRKATDMTTLTRRGSLERKSSEKRRSWSPDDFANSQ